MLMTPMTPKVMARPIAASSSTEPSESPYQAFCTVFQIARVPWIFALAASAALRTAPASAGFRPSALVAADDRDGSDLVGALRRRRPMTAMAAILSRRLSSEMMAARASSAPFPAPSSVWRERLVERRQHARLARLEHRLRRVVAPVGIGRHQRQRAVGRVDDAAQPVIDADRIDIVGGAPSAGLPVAASSSLSSWS